MKVDQKQTLKNMLEKLDACKEHLTEKYGGEEEAISNPVLDTEANGNPPQGQTACEILCDELAVITLAKTLACAVGMLLLFLCVPVVGQEELDLPTQTVEVTEPTTFTGIHYEGNGSGVALNLQGDTLTLDRVSFDNWKYGVTITGTLPDETMRYLTVKDSKFTNCSQAIRSRYANGGKWVMRFENCIFEDNNIDLFFQNIPVERATFYNCHFTNGGPESVMLVPPVEGSGNYIFTGCSWKNYTNNRTGNDADSHFIRCYGSKCIINGCLFEGLYLATETTSPADTEALRLGCKEALIVNSQFTDCGYSEGVIAVKNNLQCTIRSCKFFATDEYQVRYGSRAILANETTTVTDCEFTGFHATIVDTMGNFGTVKPDAVLTLKNLKIVDSPCNVYSYKSAVIIRSGGKALIDGLSFEGPRYPLRGLAMGTSHFTLRNNAWVTKSNVAYYYRGNPLSIRLDNETIEKGE